jgi:ferredoxin-type protein NapG
LICAKKFLAISVYSSWEIPLGKVGDHYIKGWDEADEQRVKDSNVELGKTKINKKGAIESLNSDMKDLLE